MVFKIEKNKNYTVMSNIHLRDKKLSFKAKGLLSFMLSLPEDWDYSLNGLVSISKEGKKAIRNILEELKQNGYLVIEQKRDEKGYYKYNYIIYEEPKENEKTLNHPDTQKGYADKGNTEKDIQINTKEQNDKDDKTISSFFCAKEHNPLTIDLIDRGFIDKEDVQIFYYDDLFENLLRTNSYKDLITINHYIIPRVLERDFKDEEGNQIENKYGYFKNSILNNIQKLKNQELEFEDDLDFFEKNDIYNNFNELEDCTGER